jgi:hypothetical protein
MAEVFKSGDDPFLWPPPPLPRVNFFIKLLQNILTN